ASVGATSTKAWMSYGHPCRRKTGGPEAGPASTYPTFSAPASICLTGPNDACAVFTGEVLFGGCDWAEAERGSASSADASVAAAEPRNRRRSMDVLAVTGSSSRLATRDRTMSRVNEDEVALPAMVQWTLGSYASRPARDGTPLRLVHAARRASWTSSASTSDSSRR